jgi:hypothetical protein
MKKKLESLKGNLFNDFENSRISGQSIFGGVNEEAAKSEEIGTTQGGCFDITKDGVTTSY